MNRDELHGNWNVVKGRVKQQWGKLTDDDITEIKGDADVLSGRIQKAYGKTREEAEKEVDEFVSKY